MATLKAKINGIWTAVGGGSTVNIPKTTNLFKGDGNGGIVPAVPNVDYLVSVPTSTNNLYESIVKPFTFSEKKIGFYGDSIVAGVKSGTAEGDGFVKLFSDMVGATFENHGVSGLAIATPQGLSGQALCWSLINGARSDEDIVIISAGTNDYGRGSPIGTFSHSLTIQSSFKTLQALNDYCSDLSLETLKFLWLNNNATTTWEYSTGNTVELERCCVYSITGDTLIKDGILSVTKDFTAYENVYDALFMVCEAIKLNNANIPVIFITPINRTVSGSGTATLNDYRKAIFEVATSYGHSIIDGSTLGFPSVTGDYKNFMLQDGLHPTAEGHKMYARSLCGKLL